MFVMGHRSLWQLSQLWHLQTDYVCSLAWGNSCGGSWGSLLGLSGPSVGWMTLHVASTAIRLLVRHIVLLLCYSAGWHLLGRSIMCMSS